MENLWKTDGERVCAGLSGHIGDWCSLFGAAMIEAIATNSSA